MEWRTRAAFRKSRLSITDWPEMVYRFDFWADLCQNIHIPCGYDCGLLALVSTFHIHSNPGELVETLSSGLGSDRCYAN
jgi:hypothetical protein